MAAKKGGHHKKVDKWLQGTKKKPGAIRHPGALRKAAKEHGRSTLQEARKESHSPNKHIAARGRLGLRLMGAAKHGNIGKGRHHKSRHKRAAAKA
ncbi:MAG TPA: hypothetical protein VFW94_24345 [Candidatus Acidoferrales bacterium]|nr:hypothetical protein [Candidatus Acidoferrales bacterium]